MSGPLIFDWTLSLRNYLDNDFIIRVNYLNIGKYINNFALKFVIKIIWERLN